MYIYTFHPPFLMGGWEGAATNSVARSLVPVRSCDVALNIADPSLDCSCQVCSECLHTRTQSLWVSLQQCLIFKSSTVVEIFQRQSLLYIYSQNASFIWFPDLNMLLCCTWELVRPENRIKSNPFPEKLICYYTNGPRIQLIQVGIIFNYCFFWTSRAMSLHT